MLSQEELFKENGPVLSCLLNVAALCFFFFFGQSFRPRFTIACARVSGIARFFLPDDEPTTQVDGKELVNATQASSSRTPVKREKKKQKPKPVQQEKPIRTAKNKTTHRETQKRTKKNSKQNVNSNDYSAYSRAVECLDQNQRRRRKKRHKSSSQNPPITTRSRLPSVVVFFSLFFFFSQFSPFSPPVFPVLCQNERQQELFSLFEHREWRQRNLQTRRESGQ